MNKVILMGRLVRDPEIRYSQSDNMAIARYTLAVDRRVRRDDNSQTADFISCVAFGRNAEFAEKFLKKGTKIAVSGRIQTGSYVKQDSNNTRVYTTDVVIDEQEFAESKASSVNRNGEYQGQAAPMGQTAQPAAQSAAGVQPVVGTQSAAGTQPVSGTQSASGVQPVAGTQSASGVQPTGVSQGTETQSGTLNTTSAAVPVENRGASANNSGYRFPAGSSSSISEEDFMHIPDGIEDELPFK